MKSVLVCVFVVWSSLVGATFRQDTIDLDIDDSEYMDAIEVYCFKGGEGGGISLECLELLGVYDKNFAPEIAKLIIGYLAGKAIDKTIDALKKYTDDPHGLIQRFKRFHELNEQRRRDREARRDRDSFERLRERVENTATAGTMV